MKDGEHYNATITKLRLIGKSKRKIITHIFTEFIQSVKVVSIYVESAIALDRSFIRPFQLALLSAIYSSDVSIQSTIQLASHRSDGVIQSAFPHHPISR